MHPWRPTIQVVPKTEEEVKRDKLQRDAQIDILVQNVTALIAEYKSLRSDIDSLKEVLNEKQPAGSKL